MKPLVLCASFLLALVASADSYLYWMVNDSEAKYSGQDPVTVRVVGFEGGGDWEFAWENNYLSIFTEGATDSGATAVTLDKSAYQYAPTMFAKLPGGYDGWSFYVELWNEQEIYAHSEALSYSAGAIADLEHMSEFNPTDIAYAGGFVGAGVPEPTSGLLLLIGCAGLALRRRRLVKA